MAFLWVREMGKHLRASRKLRYGWVAVGDRLEEVFSLHNEGWLPVLWVEVVDQSNVPGYDARLVQSVSAGQVLRWTQSAVCVQRGQFRLGPWQLVADDPFGIFRLSLSYPVSEELIIHPPIQTDIPIPLPGGKRSGRVRAHERALQAQINSSGVREYQTSDPINWVHWPTTARRDELYVRRFDLDAAGDIWMVLDMAAERQLGEGLDGTEEHMVLLAAALGARALAQMRPVGLAAYGQQPAVLRPSQGENQQWQLLRALALVTADGEVEIGRALQDVGRMARRGTAVVVITADYSGAWLPNLAALIQHGLQPTVILFDQRSFGGSETAEGFRQTIRQLGAPVHVIRQGDVQQIALEERRGFFEYKVTPMGKVLVVER